MPQKRLPKLLSLARPLLSPPIEFDIFFQGGDLTGRFLTLFLILTSNSHGILLYFSKATRKGPSLSLSLSENVAAMKNLMD
jgi:UPF0716 family protein affecting phage T7 exclusion